MQNLKKDPILLIFFTLSAIHLIAELLYWELGGFLTKPLLISSLAYWFFQKTKGQESMFSRYILMGLIFSIVGDTLLMFVSHSELYFLLGLGSFLFAHLCYLMGFLKYPNVKRGLVYHKTWLILPFLVFLFANTSLLLPELSASLKIPVIVYSSVITAMAIACLNMYGRIQQKTFQALFIGVLLFMLSDTLIGIDKFKPSWHVPQVGFLIMATYLSGQFLIAKNALDITKSSPSN